MHAPTPLAILQQYWGHSAFRALQEDIIQSVLAGKDTLALLPTGGGKSICFQVPALVKEGITIVISPLIALMKDQVSNLRKRNIKAEAIYSGMSIRDIDRILDNCIYGQIKLLYLSPERLKSELVQERIKKMPVSLLAIDEAHCISQWGYDFRPPYLEIAQVREWLPEVPLIALTATATTEVVKDIKEKLLFVPNNSQVFQKSFTRPNLSYVVLQEEDKMGKLVDIINKVKGTGIVYVRNRRKTKEIAQFLRKKKISADYYHAGLSNEVRSAKQEDWMQNKTRVIVSTNAFGMGIDKAEVRIVVHLDLPDNLEAYFQEAGRAGRDGKRAYAVLLYNPSDKASLERNYELAFPSIPEIKRVYQALGSYFQLAIGGGEGQSFDFDLVQFAENFQLNPIKTFNCLKALEQVGFIIMTEAVYIPASLKIRVNKDELYDFQLRNPKMDRILKAILRSYHGAFQDYIKLKETQLAKLLNMPKSELQKAFLLLRQEGIVHYIPQKESPQIVFVAERLAIDQLAIDQQLYHFRKNRHLERIQKAIAYAETIQCRQQQLIRYFGEESQEKCGICDVCLGRHETTVDSDEFEKYKLKIQRLLSREQLSLADILGSFTPKHENKVLKVLEYLLDEGFLEKHGDRLKWNAE
ncbi:MAG: ATP-dependent DNA helicase RecQ [Saprospiraceae bacterium]